MPSASQKLVSVIIPCYNEETSIGPFLERIRAVAQGLTNYGFEFLFVDDGSRDGTNAAIVEEAGEDFRVKLVTLSRNFGHQRAITAGLDLCSGDFIVIIDADLQDPPELIPKILERLEQGNDLVHMVRENRKVDSFWKRFSAKVFYALMRRYVLPELPEGAPDFKGFNRRVLEALRQHRERVRFLRGALATLGFRQDTLPYVREARHAGRSKYPAKKILTLARDAIISYSVIPLRLSLFIGVLACFAALMFAAVCVFLYCFGPGLEEPVLMLLITIECGFFGLVLIMIGILGEYVGCMMQELKHRPLYIVESVRNLTPPAGPSAPTP